MDNDNNNEPLRTQPGDRRSVLSGMFRNWYLEYASYVVLERAVPHIEDGLKREFETTFL